MIDPTVQEKNITYPTDSKLAVKIINRLNKLAKHHGIEQRRTIAHILIRELQRKLPQYTLFETYQQDFLFYQKVLSQQPKDNNKIYSLHEPHVYVVAMQRSQML